MSKDINDINPFQVFAETQGVYLADRELKFCLEFIRTSDARKAVTVAGYTDIEEAAVQLFTEHRSLIEKWKEHKQSDYYNVLDVHRRAMAAGLEIKEEGTDKVTEFIHDHKTQNMGAKGIREVMGLDAAVKQETTIKGEIPKDIKEKMAEIYKDVMKEIG
jgi:hypothetical protein